jgi:hypothetical protein
LIQLSPSICSAQVNIIEHISSSISRYDNTHRRLTQSRIVKRLGTSICSSLDAGSCCASNSKGKCAPAAKAEQFEIAAERRRELFALDHLQDVSLIKEENLSPSPGSGLQSAQARIEAYDTAHLAGTHAIGVMVVVEDGAPVKRNIELLESWALKRTMILVH